MFGPYSRMPYSRPYILTELYEKYIQAHVEAVGNIVILPIYRVVIQAYVEARGRIVRLGMGKLITASVEAATNIQKRIEKIPITAYVEAVADFTRKLTASRTIQASVEAVGSIRKEIRKRVLASAVAMASRLKLMYEEGWEFEGDFEPDDRIVVHADRLTITRNGVNVMHLADGDFPFFNPGENTLEYSDDAGERTIKLRVIYRGRWL